ncbi:hypothetical protein RRU94_23875 [Domibacillus sp. DTU_2020_1001157_1_SI_ALB_TIR_016]|uniref:hypothetical protein n=1 Tax=Domibacillus sp. DTU_2020_1001157_1_SI_ALB_TIR_016 TaxID=3077789 RepID=UPI0028F0168C|nr:hypothetical protein [Domibacillus sp. DTU_2020_1001157_1_SI_ALB_TIR_016]WNS80496.1 hypothetical protein RRU94_23875 [Domibacillus sp. DTU_2020_1001157_1_SI_ALB_TIR_016]
MRADKAAGAASLSMGQALSPLAPQESSHVRRLCGWTKLHSLIDTLALPTKS